MLLTGCGGGGSAESSSDSLATGTTPNAATLRVQAPDANTATAVAAAVITEAAPISAPATAVADIAVGTTDSTGSGTTQSILAAKNRSEDKSPAPGVATARGPALQAPYLRMVYVNGSGATASDSGPGSLIAPFKTIKAAMTNLRPGDDVVIAPGTYREEVVVPALDWGTAKTRIRAITPRTVSIKGSALTSGWTHDSGNVYFVQWNAEEPEMVFNGTQQLQQVAGTVFGGFPGVAVPELGGQLGIWPGRVAGDFRTMAENSFHFDAAAKRLYVRLSAALATGQALEVSTRPHVLIADAASGLTVEGLDFAHSNTTLTYRWGAVKVMGSNNLINDVTVTDMDGACVQLIGDDSALTNSVIDRCGQVGVTGRGTRLRIEGNQILHGNVRGFDIWWEAGGIKLIGPGLDEGLNDSVIRNNIVAYNNGNGIWVDWKNARNLIEGNTTAYNTGFGIQYEASQTATIQKNLAYGNGLRGIYLIESSGTVVTRNAVFGNALEGIAIVDGTRSATDSMLRPVGNHVSYNTIAWNDFNRNWIQLVLPGVAFGATSNFNVMKSELLQPRMSQAFLSSTNPAYERMTWWQSGLALDLNSSTETVAMPVALRAALTSQRLLLTSELPAYLLTPGMP